MKKLMLSMLVASLCVGNMFAGNVWTPEQQAYVDSLPAAEKTAAVEEPIVVVPDEEAIIVVLEALIVVQVRLPVVVVPVTSKFPPTFKFFVIPTPPAHTIPPVVVLLDCVASLIVNLPAAENTAAVVEPIVVVPEKLESSVSNLLLKPPQNIFPFIAAPPSQPKAAFV